MKKGKMNKIIGILLFPRVTNQDYIGMYEVFSRIPGYSVALISKQKGLIETEGGLKIMTDYSFNDIKKTDILFIPGGMGINGVLQDREQLEFIWKMGTSAEYITSVCTGSLTLAVTGLLDGYIATTHWRYLSLLKDFGVKISEDRVVVDRNRITGGGVTAGIDLALKLVGLLLDTSVAKMIELQLEYNPQPPYGTGHPRLADAHTLNMVMEKTEKVFLERKEIMNKLKSQSSDFFNRGFSA